MSVVKDVYGCAVVCEKTNILDLKSFFGTCPLRDDVTTTGTGAVTNDYVETCMTVSAAGDVAELGTHERSVYVPGLACEVGISLRADPTDFEGEQVLTFGLYDSMNGYFFMLTSDGVTLCVRKGGSDIVIPHTEWNGDFGDRGEVNILVGAIFCITFGHYGYSPVIFSIMHTSANGDLVNRVLHTYGASSGMTCDNPHLPIKIRLEANGSSTPASAYVSTRQLSVVGNYDPPIRISSFSFTKTAVTSASWAVAASFLKRETHAGCAMRAHGVDIIATTPCYVSFVLGATLTSANFEEETVENGCPSVTGLTKDVSATAFDDGIRVYAHLFPSGYSTVSLADDKLDLGVDSRPFSVVIKAVDANTDVTCMIRFEENF